MYFGWMSLVDGLAVVLSPSHGGWRGGKRRRRRRRRRGRRRLKPREKASEAGGWGVICARVCMVCRIYDDTLRLLKCVLTVASDTSTTSQRSTTCTHGSEARISNTVKHCPCL